MDKCIFCEIVAGKQPASIILHDDMCFAFMDIQPVNPGHVLVIPKAHATGLAELGKEAGARMFVIAQDIGAALRKSGVRCEGINLHLADGRAAGQEVFHVHLHVVPRFSGDGFGLRFGPHYGQKPARNELTSIAEKIRGVLRTIRCEYIT